MSIVLWDLPEKGLSQQKVFISQPETTLGIQDPVAPFFFSEDELLISLSLFEVFPNYSKIF